MMYEKVIKGLECCADAQSDRCSPECPYRYLDDCTDLLKLDALESIKKLRAEKGGANE